MKPVLMNLDSWFPRAMRKFGRPGMDGRAQMIKLMLALYPVGALANRYLLCTDSFVNCGRLPEKSGTTRNSSIA